MLRVCLTAAHNIDPPLWREWEHTRRTNPALQSPFFAPEFAQIVGAVRNDLEVGVISRNGSVIAFFPFQRKKSEASHAVPIADSMSEFQGLICNPNFECNPLELIDRCGLVSYEFRHFITSQRFFLRCPYRLDSFHQIDVSQGSGQRKGTPGLIRLSNDFARRLHRDLGPLRFVALSHDPALLRRVMDLKSDQDKRTGVRDLYGMAWVRSLIEKIHATQSDEFAGVLSLLYAGNNLIAGYFGVRSRTVLHYWIPAYDPAMATYLPEMNLILNMAKHGPSVGLRTIGFDSRRILHKRRASTGGIPVAKGKLDLRRGGALDFLRPRLPFVCDRSSV
jgi:CelD/BcsL family acetyltransferase involved in cellulose biosynthesis